MQNADTHFDVIVIGVGSMGSAACYYLARKGARVLGLEQFNIPHELGSHAGQSRIIRKAYFEHPSYVPLLELAYANWDALAEETGSEIFVRTGLLYLGKQEHQLMDGTKQAAVKYGIQLETLGEGELAKRHPGVRLPENYRAYFEPDAGFITPEKAVSLFAERAVQHGAEIRTGVQATNWKKEGTGFMVETNKGRFYAEKLLFCAGPWTARLLPLLKPSLSVTRQSLAWVVPKDPNQWALGNWPCWTLSEDDVPGIFYGFPVLPAHRFGEPVGFKIAHHAAGQETDPDHVLRSPIPEDEQKIRRVLDQYFPGMFLETRIIKTCLYTNTPDEHFIIDHLNGYESGVTIAAGFSGHGFKFASALGQILAELSLEGRTSHPIDFLQLGRLAQ